MATVPMRNPISIQKNQRASRADGGVVTAGRRPRVVGRYGWLLMGIAAAWLGGAGTAMADDRNIYIGVSTTAEFLNATFDKDTIYQSNRIVNSDATNIEAYGFGILAGYRLPLNNRGLYLSTEFDVMLHGRNLEGQLPDLDPDRDFNRYGDNWNDRWTLDKQRSYGLTFKFGGSAYILAGVRRIKTEFGVDFQGCTVPGNTCAQGNIASGSNTFKRDFTAWTAGGGLEKMVSENVGVRFETRYVAYLKEDWVTLAGVGGEIRVPSAVTGDEVNVSLQLVHYF